MNPLTKKVNCFYKPDAEIDRIGSTSTERSATAKHNSNLMPSFGSILSHNSSATSLRVLINVDGYARGKLRVHSDSSDQNNCEQRVLVVDMTQSERSGRVERHIVLRFPIPSTMCSYIVRCSLSFGKRTLSLVVDPLVRASFGRVLSSLIMTCFQPTRPRFLIPIAGAEDEDEILPDIPTTATRVRASSPRTVPAGDRNSSSVECRWIWLHVLFFYGYAYACQIWLLLKKFLRIVLLLNLYA